MHEKIKMTIQQKTVTAKGLGAEEAAAFQSLVPESSMVMTVVTPAAHHLPDKQRKELEAVCAFARMREFSEMVLRFTGSELTGDFDVEILWDGDDPPDAILTVTGKSLGIDVTDYPPDQAALMKAMAKISGPAPLPAFHEGGCNPKTILEFMQKPVSMVEPEFSSADDEAKALFRYAEAAIRKKDEARCSDILLLHGPVAFSFPAEEVIDYIVRSHRFVSLKAVAFLRTNDCRIWPTNLA